MALVKKLIALVLAMVSGVYLLLGPLPDPLPLLDEGMALLILVQSLAYLGIDLRRWVPGLAKKAKAGPAGGAEGGRTIDV